MNFQYDLNTNSLTTRAGTLGWPAGAENDQLAEPLSVVSQLVRVPVPWPMDHVEPFGRWYGTPYEEIIGEGDEAIEAVTVRVPEQARVPDQYEEASPQRAGSRSSVEDIGDIRSRGSSREA